MPPQLALEDVLLPLGVATVAGLMIGTEREQSGFEGRFAGVRTFPLIGLAGAVAALVGPWLLATLALGLGALLLAAYLRDRREQPGISSEMAAMVTFALGALATAHQLPMATTHRLLLVVACATAVLGLLSLKQPLHGFVERISQPDMYAAAKLAALAVILLPLLPAREMGPWGALNPRRIGLLVVLISAVGFAGYVATRALGAHRGFGLSGLLGGLASSTAVTLTFAGRARESAGLLGPAALAIVLGSATMFPRVLLLVAAADPPLVRATAGPLLAAGATGYALGAVLFRRIQRAERDARSGEVRLDNPFSLRSALKFALVFTLVLLGSRAAAALLGRGGVYLAAVVAGLVEMDAITLSVVNLHRGGQLDATAAANAITLAAATNTVAKAGIAAVLGGRSLGLRVGATLAVVLAVAGLERLLVG